MSFWFVFLFSCSSMLSTLVTQPMMQCRLNPRELRSMVSYIQILCRFQRSKQKVPPPSLPCTKKSPFTPKDKENLGVEELFAYFFGIYIEFGYKNPLILTPLDSVDVAS